MLHGCFLSLYAVKIALCACQFVLLLEVGGIFLGVNDGQTETSLVFFAGSAFLLSFFGFFFEEGEVTGFGWFFFGVFDEEWGVVGEFYPFFVGGAEFPSDFEFASFAIDDLIDLVHRGRDRNVLHSIIIIKRFKSHSITKPTRLSLSLYNHHYLASCL